MFLLTNIISKQISAGIARYSGIKNVCVQSDIGLLFLSIAFLHFL